MLKCDARLVVTVKGIVTRAVVVMRVVMREWWGELKSYESDGANGEKWYGEVAVRVKRLLGGWW